MPVARLLDLGEECIFMEQYFCFDCMLKIVCVGFSGHNKIWGAQKIGGGTAPEPNARVATGLVKAIRYIVHRSLLLKMILWKGNININEKRLAT